jgi:hypothetical protein
LYVQKIIAELLGDGLCYRLMPKGPAITTALTGIALRHALNPTPPRPLSSVAQVDGSGIPAFEAPVKVTLILTPPSPNPVPDSRPSLVVQGTDKPVRETTVLVGAVATAAMLSVRVETAPIVLDPRPFAARIAQYN